MEINGLPLHPLIVHLVVVLLPVSAVVALTYVGRPSWEPALRWPLAALGAASALLTWLAAASGDSLKDLVNPGGPAAELVEKHEEWAGRLQVGTWVFGVVCVLVALQAARSIGPVALQRVLQALLVISAVAVVFLAFKTGDAGAQAVWSGYTG